MLVAPRVRMVALAVSACCWLPTAAHADQVVIFDATWVHAPDIPDSHYNAMPLPETPASWVSPVDYSQGTAHVYLEVLTKPTAQDTKFQVCFNSSPTYACTDQSPTYTTTGTVEWPTPVQNFWHPPEADPDWSLGISGLSAILKDTMNNKPSADNVGDEVAALYMPTEVRMVVTLVSPGGEYTPPTPTGEETTTGDTTTTGDGDTSGDDATTSPATSASTAETATTDTTTQTTAPDATSTSGGTSTSADPDDCDCCLSEYHCTTFGPQTDSFEDTGTTADPPSTTDDDPSGCACTSRPSGPASALALLTLAGLPRRRRRPR
jgi:MYXO-CTERM domain-containing protein